MRRVFRFSSLDLRQNDFVETRPVLTVVVDRWFDRELCRQFGSPDLEGTEEDAARRSSELCCSVCVKKRQDFGCEKTSANDLFIYYFVSLFCVRLCVSRSCCFQRRDTNLHRCSASTWWRSCVYAAPTSAWNRTYSQNIQREKWINSLSFWWKSPVYRNVRLTTGCRCCTVYVHS